MFLIAQVLTNLLYVFIIVMLIRVIFSWISPYPTNAVTRFAYRVTEPILAPVRRWLPPMSGIDLSPMVVMLGTYFLIIILRNVY
ncbi:MAG TPA: YggT family protein [Candidatus Dormibacteraeota bacterium]